MAVRRPMGGDFAAQLLERQAELAAIAGAFDDVASGSGRLVVVEGEAGIGKTALLNAALEMAAARRMRTLRAAGSELEQVHPFGVAASLLRPLVRDAGGWDTLVGPAEPARAIFDPGAGRHPDTADPLSVVHAAMWVIADAAEAAPMVLAVDDLHWADEPSLRVLASLAHRLQSTPVALLVGTRLASSSAPRVTEQIRSHRDAVRLPLRHLTHAGVATLIDRVDARPDSRPNAERIWADTGGNPFYVVELVRASDGLDQDALDDVPDAVRASIRRRLTASGEAATPVAEAVAVLGDEATIDFVAKLAALTETDTEQAVRRLTDRAILMPDGLAFTHPIVRTTIVDAIPAAIRPRMHRQAADVLAEGGRPATTVATHLLASAPMGDGRVVEKLREAARIALAQGDPGAAVGYLSRAAEEPPAPSDRGSVLLELARAEAAVGSPGANDRFEAAIRHLEHEQERAQARLAQGHALIQSARWGDAARTFEAGLNEVDPRDAELKSRLEAGFVSSAYVGLTDHAEANRRLERILAAPLHDPAHRELAAWTAFQQVMTVTATASESVSLARRSLEGASLDELITSSQVIELVSGVLISTGEVIEEVGILDTAIAAAQGMNAHQKVGIYHYCRSLPNLMTGRLADAIADAETALAIHDLGWEVFYPGTCAALAWAHLERGNRDAAQRALAMDDSVWEQRLDYQFMVRIARGRVRSAFGDHVGAIEQYHLARDAGSTMGIRTPAVLAGWHAWCAVELRLAGDRTAAIELAEEALEIALAWKAPLGEARARWALGVARGDRDGLGHLEASVAGLEDGPIQLELTRSLVDLGAAQRRAGRLVDARESLKRGADLAHRLGAAALGERARDELIAAGARPRRYATSGVSALTPSELRVARLVAAGRTNRETAQALFVTPKAVEYHLANVYRKLHIPGRAKLTAALDDGAAAAG